MASHFDAGDTTAGYVSGPAAATEPRRLALGRIVDADQVVLVEGVTDQIAVEALAARVGRQLDREGVVVAPMGGAHAIDTFLDVLARGAGPPQRICGMCDRRESPVVSAALARVGHGSMSSDADLERVGFFVCDADLEGELIAALGAQATERLLDCHGDLGAFRTLQRQAPWSGRPLAEQLHRFLRARARRMHHYAGRLVEAVELERMPRPLLGVLDLS
jgi:hypothetical protein